MPILPPSLRSLGRSFLRSPGFVLITVLTMGLGIGANAAIFSVINAVLLRPLPYPEAERIVAVWHDAPGIGLRKFQQSDATYLIYRKENRVLEDFAIYGNGSANLTGGGEPVRLSAAGVTASMFHVLRVPPVLGRALAEADERPGADPVVLLSADLWQSRFGGDRSVLGTTLRVDGVTRRVIGVMPADFHFPQQDTQLWVPLTLDPAKLQSGNFNYDAIGRLLPGVTPKRAAKELSQLVWRIPEEAPGSQITRGMLESAQMTILVHPLRDDVVGDIQRILWVLLGSVGTILGIACANVANLFLVRAEGRQREVAVRTALGGTRLDVARLFLGESVALSLAGGVLGLALAAAGVRLLVALRPQGIPRLDEIHVDGAVLLFTLALAIASGLLFGLFAVLRYGTPELVVALKEGGKGGTAGRERHRARNVLVVAQIALALVLLVGAGLMGKSFWRLRNVNPGLDPRGVLTVHLYLPDSDYTNIAAANFVQRLMEKIYALPGVTAAGTVTGMPLSGSYSNSGYSFEDFPLPKDVVPPLFANHAASPEYFKAMGVPLLEGKPFDAINPQQPSRDVIVSQALAHRFWPGKSPLGKRLASGLQVDPSQWATIVGVVGSVRARALEDPPLEAVYSPWISANIRGGSVPHDFSLIVRGTGNPLRLAGPVREAVRSLDPNLPLSEVRPMAEVVERSMARTSFTMLLLGIAATLALVLGAVGIYGVVAYIVSQRTREIGVRMALGARRQDVERMVLRQGLGLAVTGVVLGLAAALAVTRLMSSLLFEVKFFDPATFLTVPLVLAAVALLASWVPAQRAARVEPLEAIRYE